MLQVDYLISLSQQTYKMGTIITQERDQNGGWLAQTWLPSLRPEYNALMLHEPRRLETKTLYGWEGEVGGPTDVRLHSGPAA